MSRYDNIQPIDSVRLLKIDGIAVGYISTFQWTTLEGGEEIFLVYKTKKEADDERLGAAQHIVLPAGTNWELWRI